MDDTAPFDQHHGPIVVGVDGSPESLRAVDLAAREATLRGRPLEVVHGLGRLAVYPPPGLPAGAPPEGELGAQADQLVAAAVARACEVAPTIEVSGEVVQGSGAEVLIGRSAVASMLVMGDRGRGAFTGLLLGSVAIHVTSHATCPVVVARGTTDAALPVLVATDGSRASAPAVGFAFAAAQARRVPLHALYVWPHPAAPTLAQDSRTEALADAEESRVLDEALAGWRHTFVSVPVRRTVAHGYVAAAIIDATRDAQLVVLGARGHGGFTGLLLGSVSQAVLRHAACPTAIVPHPYGR